MNQALRSGSRDALQEWGTYLRTVMSGLGKLPAHVGTVYRGVPDLSPAQLARYKVGATVTEPSFTSTSTDPKGAFGGNTRFVIRSRTGRDVAPLSQFGHEAEILFAPGTSFRVLKVDVDGPSTTIYLGE